MEKDHEVSGESNSYDFGARLYNPRVGRWLSVDPLEMKYKSIAPYVFVGKMPIIAIDPDGRDVIIITQEGETIKVKADLSNIDDEQLRSM